MPSVGRFIELLEAASRRDMTTLKKVGEAVAEEERQKKHFSAAHQIAEAVEVAASSVGYDRVGTVSNPTPFPQSAPPVDVLQLEPSGAVSCPILPSAQEAEVRELIAEWQSEVKLRAAGVAPRHTVLLHGPPGCGKTHLAKHIGSALEMPLYVVRFDSLVSSYLGETGANLRHVFDFIASNRCALLIDEIDAIAKLRDDKNELGELKRVVISLLQNIDLANTRSILIAATNHPHLLDHALWRRFEVVWEMGELSGEGRVQLLSHEVADKLSPVAAEGLTACTKGMSGADIVRVAQAARRRMVLRNVENLDEAILMALIDHFTRRATGENGAQQHDERTIAAAMALRSLDRKKYSFQALERVTGIPHSTLHHRQKQRRQT